MNKRVGQGALMFAEVLHQLGRIALLFISLVLFAIVLLGFRLSAGPLEIPYLAGHLATAVSGQGISIQMRKAELAWDGYHQGGGVPLSLQLGDIVVRNQVGVALATIPTAKLIVLPSDLFGAGDPILVSASGARLTGADAPASLRAQIRLSAGFRLARADLVVTLGQGLLGAGENSERIRAGGFTLVVTPGSVTLSEGALALAPSGASAPNVTFSGAARLGAAWTGTLHVSADAVQAADLPAYWPPRVLVDTRNWVTQNIIAGTAGNAAFTFALAAPTDLSTLRLTGVSGGFTGQDLTLKWLPGAVPITRLNGRMDFTGLDSATVTADTGQLGGLALTQGQLVITGISHARQIGQLSLRLKGGVADVIAVLNAPPLNLLRAAPPGLVQATGRVDGAVIATIPFLINLQLQNVTLNVAAGLSHLSVASGVAGLVFDQSEGQLKATGNEISVVASGRFAGEPAGLTLHEVFANNQQRVALNGLAGPLIWHQLGLDAQTAFTDPASGLAPFTLTIAGDAAGAQQAEITADLTPAALSAPSFGWAKPAGVPGRLAAAATLERGNLSALERIDVTAPGLNIQSRLQGSKIIFSALDIGATRAAGVVTPPGPGHAAWLAALSGSVLDARAISSPRKNAAKQPPAPPSNAPPTGPAWDVTLDFAQLDLAAAPAPDFSAFTFTGNGVGETLLAGHASAQGMALEVTPFSPLRRRLTLRADDAGLLLRALGAYSELQGGTLSLEEAYGGAAPADGLLVLEKFRILQVPVFAKVMQGLTLYGVRAATSGPGLGFDRAVAPFTMDATALHLRGARAFSDSLGFTASGSIALGDGTADIDATIVPAYAINTLPGKIPLIGHLFTAEKGGGLFALRAKITGLLTDPHVAVNPLSALTPGVLRDLFGLGGS
jgi:hypothetical protein